MASTLALGPCCTAVAGLLAANSPLMTKVGSRIYGGASGDIPQRPQTPFVSVESSGELPFNTMGPVDALKWGSDTTVAVRVSSKYRSEKEVRTLTDLVKQTLDGQPISVPGYGRASVLFLSVQFLEDFSTGEKVREWVSLYSVLVHQGT